MIDCHYHHDRLAKAVGGRVIDSLSTLCGQVRRAPIDAGVVVEGEVAEDFPSEEGKMGAPHLLFRTLGALARVRGDTVDELAAQATANTLRLFA